MYKTTDKADANTQFFMPWYGNATSPDAPLYFRQDLLIKENIGKGIDLGHFNEKIYVDFARREGTSLSETIRDPRVVNNRRNNSKVKQATHSKVKYLETECIVTYLKANDSFVKTFFLDCEQYSALNYISYQLTDIRRFCVEGQGIFSIDTTFEIFEGLYLTDTSYPNKPLIDKSNGKHPQFPGPSFWHFKKNEEAYRRFAGEILIADPSLAGIKKIGHDLDRAIAKGTVYQFPIHIFLKTSPTDFSKSLLSPQL